MPCSLCGDICRCTELPPAASPRWMPDRSAPVAISTVELSGAQAQASVGTGVTPGASEVAAPEAAEALSDAANYSAAPASTDDEPLEASTLEQDSPAWRLEVAARLNRYQARRKPRPPRYPSLRLRFESEELDHHAQTVSGESNGHPMASGGRSSAALALDSLHENTALEPQSQGQALFLDSALAAPLTTSGPGESPTRPAREAASDAVHPTAKIIEFPRSSSAPPPPLDELAEPVMDRPRILEAPSLAPPLPALGGILMEAAEKQAIEKRPGIDIPLQSAPLARRILAAGLDAFVVARSLRPLRICVLENRRRAPAEPATSRRCGRAGLLSLGGKPVSVAGVLKNNSGPAGDTAGIDLLRWHSRGPARAPLASAGVFPFRRVSRNGLSMGLSG